MDQFAIRQDPAELKAAFELQIHAELVSVRLKECRVLGPSGGPDPDSGLKLAMRHDAARIDSPASQLCVDVGFHFDATETSKEAHRLFQIDCRFDLTYVLGEGFSPTDGQVSAFKDGNAIFNCWPYAREFVQSLATRMGLQVPPLPLLRVLPRPPEKPAEGAETATQGKPARRSRARARKPARAKAR